MQIPWTGKRCILCLKEAPLSAEHLIPDALGGVLTCDFLCRDCNSTLGYSFEAEARTDPDIQLARHKLQGQMSDELAQKLFEGQSVLIQGPGWQEPGKIRKGEPRVKSRVERYAPDITSYIQPADTAVKSEKNMMKEEGIDENSIAKVLRMVDEAPSDRKVTLTPNLEVIKWSYEKITLDLSNNKTMSPLVPLKIAYEFLAWQVSTAIYNEIQALQELRAVLQEATEEDPCFKVERLHAPEYEPFHGICFEGNDPYAQVQIRLFGHLAFRVHFLKLSVSGPRGMYWQSVAGSCAPQSVLLLLDDPVSSGQ